MRSVRNHLAISLGIISSTIVLDQVTKVLARMYLQGKEPISFLNNFFVLQYAENRGAFLSMGRALPDTAWTILFAIVPAIFLIGLMIYVLKKRDLPLTETIIYSGIVAGGLGNLYDRIRFGYVTDFMNFGIGSLRTGILNVADIPITMGIIYLLIYYTIKDIKKKREKSVEA